MSDKEDMLGDAMYVVTEVMVDGDSELLDRLITALSKLGDHEGSLKKAEASGYRKGVSDTLDNYTENGCRDCNGGLCTQCYNAAIR